MTGDGCGAEHLSIQSSYDSVRIWVGLGGCYLPSPRVLVYNWEFSLNLHVR